MVQWPAAPRGQRPPGLHSGTLRVGGGAPPHPPHRSAAGLPPGPPTVHRVPRRSVCAIRWPQGWWVGGVDLPPAPGPLPRGDQMGTIAHLLYFVQSNFSRILYGVKKLFTEPIVLTQTIIQSPAFTFYPLFRHVSYYQLHLFREIPKSFKPLLALSQHR